MGIAIPALSAQTTMNIQSDCEYALTRIMNTLTKMAMEQQSIVQDQMTAGQLYMAQHTDEEGQPTEAAIEYVNSQAFNAYFTNKLNQIKTKEQQLQMQKQQIELKRSQATTLRESWDKSTSSNIEKTFKYGN